VIVESAPNDLSVVAGLVSALPQSLGSHLNLRLREKRIPSVAVPTIYDNSLAMGLSDRLAHLVADADSVVLEPARFEDAKSFWDKRRPNVGQPRANLDVATLRRLADLRAVDAIAYGVKAANLGELHPLLPVANRVEGFAIPFRAYADFARERGIQAKVAEVLADRQIRTDGAYRRVRLSELRTLIRTAPLLPDFTSQVEAQIRSVYGADGPKIRLRFRSSTNAEDLPGLTGAGLYDSTSGCLGDDLDGDTVGPSACLSAEHETYLRAQLALRGQELLEHPERVWLSDIIDDLEGDLANEKSVFGAIRRVWASLWNERAFDEREYYGLEHARVFMAIAVHPSFVGEKLESVIVTNLEPGSQAPLYRVVSQAGEVGVVEPADPTATPEVLTFRRGPSNVMQDVRLVAASSLTSGAALWSDARLGELSSLLFQIQDHFASGVYPDLSPLSLDIEVDVTMDGRTVVKQARPYVELGP
jgi:pyruvate, water dikinase